MRIVLVGPGRAGGSMARRLLDTGHTVVGVLARRAEAAREAADLFEADVLTWDGSMPAADLLLIAVRDDAIGEVAGRLAPLASAAGGAVHLSGLTPVAALQPLAATMPTGSFHPLQTLPDGEAGAARLAGAWVGITSEDAVFADRLFALAHGAGMHPFELDDECRAVYHAAAAAAANYTLTTLAMAERLFAAAGVPFAAAEPLVRAVIDNGFSMGPAAALTGPIARGDVGTVRAQLVAVAEASPELAEDFRTLGRATARLAGTGESMEEALR